MSSRKSKKQRTGTLPSFGAPSDADSPSSQNDLPSSSAFSTRLLPLSTIPTLSTLCARVFVINFPKMRRNEAVWERVSIHLAALPMPLVPKISAMLRSSCPTYLQHEFIVTYLFRGPSITLGRDLPGVQKRTILDIPRFNPDIHELELSSFTEITDTVFASVVRQLSNLQVLVLRGCTKVGVETAHAIGESCPGLQILNLNYTSVLPVSLLPLATSPRSRLEVLKLAGIRNWAISQTDATFANFIAGIEEDFTLPSLRTLKLRQTSLSDASMSSILKRCPGLQRLDVSFTSIRHPPFLTPASSPFKLQKLSLTSTAVSAIDLINTIRLLPELQTLAIGALGGSHGSRSNSSAMTLTDDTLRTLSDILEPSHHLKNMSLVGNTKLGSSSKSDRALLHFITHVGRKCKKLNLAGIPSLRSSDLLGLLPTDINGPSSLETLILNNTGVDDEAGAYLRSCPSLGTLGLAGTKITGEGLLPIIDSCLKLEHLDLTSCRGIKVVDRRQFFEVWEEARV